MNIRKLDDLINFIEDYKFKNNFICSNCGKCCKDILIKQEGYSFDIYGNFTQKPTLSAVVSDFEKEIFEKKCKKEYGFTLKLKPSIVFFLKNYKVGFIFAHLIPVDSITNNCIYYDIKKERCLIYRARPIVCRVYPITSVSNQFDQSVLTISNTCRSFLNDVKQDYLGDLYVHLLKSPLLSEKFQKQLILYSLQSYLTIEEAKSFQIIRILFRDLDDPQIANINDYQLFDFQEFSEWGIKNFKRKIELKLLKRYEESLQARERSLNNLLNRLKKDINHMKKLNPLYYYA